MHDGSRMIAYSLFLLPVSAFYCSTLVLVPVTGSCSISPSAHFQVPTLEKYIARMRIAREDEGSGNNANDNDSQTPKSPQSSDTSKYATPGTETPTSIPELATIPTDHTKTDIERVTEGRIDRERRGSWSSTHSSNWYGADRSEAEKDYPPKRSSHDIEQRASQASRTSDISRTLSRTLSRARSQNTNGMGIDEVDETDEVDEEASGEQGEGRSDVIIVKWDGGDQDPMNPRRFSSMRKWLVVWINSFSALCVTVASSIYITTQDQMNAEFGNSRIVGTLGLSLFVFGLATGPLFLAPMSEFYGRRPVYLVSYAFYAIWLVPSAVAKNIQTMLVARFLCGFSGSAFLSVSGGSVGDMFVRDKLQEPMMIFTGAPFLGPALGPVLGGFINEFTDWRWTYYMLLIWSGVQYICLVFFVPETYHPAVLRKKAQKLRKSTGDQRYKSAMELQEKSVLKSIGISLYRPMQLLTQEFMVQALCLYSAILLGILYLFFGAFPLVFRTNHDFSLYGQGLTFVGIMVGMILAILSDPIWHRNYDRLMFKREKATGEKDVAEPEFRLPPAIAGSILVPIGMFWFGWTTYRSVHWIVPLLGSAFFGAG